MSKLGKEIIGQLTPDDLVVGDEYEVKNVSTYRDDTKEIWFPAVCVTVGASYAAPLFDITLADGHVVQGRRVEGEYRLRETT